MKKLKRVLLPCLVLGALSFGGLGQARYVSSAQEIVQVAEDTKGKLPPINKKEQEEKKKSSKGFLKGLNFFDEKAMEESAKVMSPVIRIVVFVVSVLTYVIFAISLLMTVPDMAYINVPLLRRLLGGPDGASADGANSPMGYSSGFNNGMYGMNTGSSIDPRRNRLGGLVSDEAKSIVKDPSIIHKNMHYIGTRVISFLSMGACTVILLSSMWFGYGLWVGSLILDGARYLFSLFGA
jgi:hypothetical protein